MCCIFTAIKFKIRKKPAIKASSNFVFVISKYCYNVLLKRESFIKFLYDGQIQMLKSYEGDNTLSIIPMIG